MNLQIQNTNKNSSAGIVISLINSIRDTLEYLPMVNDHNKIESFKNYIFSRFVDKLTSISVNYVKIEWMVNTLKFKEIDNIKIGDNSRLQDESHVELIATILRPLTEIFLELKSIELSREKFEIDIETCCQILYFDSINQTISLKRSISQDIYDCDPKYFKIWNDTNSKEFNRIRQQLSDKNIFLLQNVKNKYKNVLQNCGEIERLILGYDYFSHYAIISKKAHFSYTNIPKSQFKPTVYLTWCLFYIVVIYENLMRLSNKSDLIYEAGKSLFEHIKNMSQVIDIQYVEGDIIMIEFGIAKIEKIKGLTFEIIYLYSNCFKKNEKDAIPRIFVFGKVNQDFLHKTANDILPADQIIYEGEKYDRFYNEIFNVTYPSEPIDLKRKNRSS